MDPLGQFNESKIKIWRKVSIKVQRNSTRWSVPLNFCPMKLALDIQLKFLFNLIKEKKWMITNNLALSNPVPCSIKHFLKCCSII